MKTCTATIDWDAFLHTVRQFPHLRQVVIQHSDILEYSVRQILVEFLAHLGEAWFGLGELLELYYIEKQNGDGYDWVQLRLSDTVMDEIEQRVCLCLRRILHIIDLMNVFYL